MKVYKQVKEVPKVPAESQERRQRDPSVGADVVDPVGLASAPRGLTGLDPLITLLADPAGGMREVVIADSLIGRVVLVLKLDGRGAHQIVRHSHRIPPVTRPILVAYDETLRV